MIKPFEKPKSIHRLGRTKIAGNILYHVAADLAQETPETGFIQGEIALEMLKSINADVFWLHMLISASAVDEKETPNLKNIFFIPKLDVYQALGLNKQNCLTEKEKELRVQTTVDELNNLLILVTDWQEEPTPLWQISKNFDHFGQKILNGEWSLMCQAGQWLKVLPYEKSMHHFSYFSRDIFKKLNESSYIEPNSLWIILQFDNRFNYQQKRISVSNLEIMNFTEQELPLEWQKQKQLIKKTVELIQSQVKHAYQVDYRQWPEYIHFLFKQEGTLEENKFFNQKIYPRDWDDFLYCVTYFRQQANPAWTSKVINHFSSNTYKQVNEWSGEQLKILREKLSWNQKQLAIYLQISESMVSKLECNQRTVRLEYQEKLNQIKNYVII